ncbi:DUF5702 domain-containing protein [Lacrimispora sp. NSJ-141]|uniref:DUF5702 domain-containing protein n=1 Tax=Lientehia hominis TaxID=2897778 RepID=A0AAP2RLN6_9FIRM|nr:DUF5702 domain-containing protein [Lientehia hominis]MCD2493500.1 DUF5702 domain-containing protein [Lientehia hominis]
MYTKKRIRKWENRGYQGSLTVFFALILTVLTAIVCTSLESARYSALSYFTAQAQESALESVFAGYYRPLWEKYHMFFVADSPGLIPAMEDYLSYYEETGNGAVKSRTDLYGFRSEGSQAVEIVTVMDDGGAPFFEEIGEDMKKHGAEKMISSLTGKDKLAEEAETVSSYMEQLSEYGTAVTEIEESFALMDEQGRKLKEQYDSLYKAMELKEWPETMGSEMTDKAASCAAEALRISGREYEKIMTFTEQLKKGVELEEARLLEEQEKVSETAYEIMEEGIRNLSEYTEEEGSRRKAADSLKELLEKQAGGLLNIKPWENGEITDAFSEAVKQGKESMKDLPYEKGQDEKREESSLLKAVKDWKDQGVLALVLDDTGTVSEAYLKEGTYPSGLGSSKGQSPDGAMETAIKKGTAALYMTEHFGTFRKTEEDTVLSYEMEYIIGKYNNDKENLTAAVEKLIGLRSGMNFMYLLQDKEKSLEAEALAAALVGFTGIYPLIRLTAKLLLAAWALAEAVNDVRRLIKGDEVPLLKSSSDWNLSLTGAEESLKAEGKTIQNRTQEERTGGQQDFWIYERYLQILFLLGETERQGFRAMDLMEANFRQKDPGFFMENCVYHVSVETTFQAEARFSQIPFMKRDGASAGKYRFRKLAAYGYQNPRSAGEK